MSNYSKTTDFAAKDALSTGNAAKIVKGTEIDDEFDAIQVAVNTKANANNAALTGVPTAPTASASVSTTQIATTAFVTSKAYATLASPALTGTPTAPTASAGTDTTQIATTAFVIAVRNAIYPVGSIYSNAAVATNPGTLLGFGTWAAYGAGRVMVGLDGTDAAFDTLSETGGAATHTLSIAELPAHTHTFNTITGTDDDIDAGGSFKSTNTGTTGSTGGDAAHNNLQPYIVGYMWKRTG